MRVRKFEMHVPSTAPLCARAVVGACWETHGRTDQASAGVLRIEEEPRAPMPYEARRPPPPSFFAAPGAIPHSRSPAGAEGPAHESLDNRWERAHRRTLNHPHTHGVDETRANGRCAEALSGTCVCRGGGLVCLLIARRPRGLIGPTRDLPDDGRNPMPDR